MERAVDWQELSVSSRGMSRASCYSFNLCRRDKELLFDSECFADGERLKFYEVPVTAEELTPLDKLIQQLPWQLRQPSASRPANLPREMIEVHDCGSFSLTLLTATGEKLVCRTDIEQQQELLRELQRLAKQVHEQKRDAGHEKMHPMRGFRLFRELPEKKQYGLRFWQEFSRKTEKFCSSYPKSAVWVGCFSKFRCTMSL